jgi:hypothetical protein
MDVRARIWLENPSSGGEGLFSQRPRVEAERHGAVLAVFVRLERRALSSSGARVDPGGGPGQLRIETGIHESFVGYRLPPIEQRPGQMNCRTIRPWRS